MSKRASTSGTDQPSKRARNAEDGDTMEDDSDGENRLMNIMVNNLSLF